MTHPIKITEEVLQKALDHLYQTPAKYGSMTEALTYLGNQKTRVVEELVKQAAKDKTFAKALFLRVIDKKGRVVPIHETRIHSKFNRTRKRFSLVVKGRQVYFTTDQLAEAFLDCIKKTARCLFMNLNAKVTEEVFQRALYFSDNCPIKKVLPKQVRDTTKFLSWENGSQFSTATISNDSGTEAAKRTARSGTWNRVHGTEAAFWNHYDVIKPGLLATCPADAFITFESTGNGAKGGFYEDFKTIVEQGQQVEPGVWVLNDQSAHFSAWWEHPEYRLQENPIDLETLPPESRELLDETERYQLREMLKDEEMTETDCLHAIWFRRWYLVNRLPFHRDPHNAVRSWNEEFPATWRDAFQAGGASFFSSVVTDQAEEHHRHHNATAKLPRRIDLFRGADGIQSESGTDIYLFAAPERGEQWVNRYCIGADIGSGNPDSDYDAIWVKDRVRGAYVAVAHGHYGPKRAAELMLLLGEWYDMAILAPEVNNHGIGTVVALYDAQYPNVYRYSETNDTYKGWGWRTDERSRKLALEWAKIQYESEAAPKVPYLPFYGEIRTFTIQTGKTKPEAAPGKHDDLVMAYAITEMVDRLGPRPEMIRSVPVYEYGTPGFLKQQAMGSNKKSLRNIYAGS